MKKQHELSIDFNVLDHPVTAAASLVLRHDPAECTKTADF